MKSDSNKIALYMRLSRDDEKCGESMSIENQRLLLRRFVKDLGGEIAGEYVDDGFSGTSFDRPAVTRLLEDAKCGKIDTVIVKDLSRFGRNYIQVGQYIDYIFPAYGIRFIAVGDGVDTADKSSSGMDMLPIMNVFNEWHSANTSKKIRAVIKAKQRAGIYTGAVYPYGYKAGNDEKRTAVIDDTAAKVVERIFDLRLQGKSVSAIARILSDDGVPNPATYHTKLNGQKINAKFSPLWNPKTVSDILKNPAYLGNLIQHKTTTVSYKNRKRVTVPADERLTVEYAHLPIISREVWEAVQAINCARTRGRSDNSGVTHPLSGLLICPDCGKRIRLTNGKNPQYICRTYKDLGKKYCSSHAISEEQLNALILSDIRSMISNIALDGQKEKSKFLKVLERRGENCGTIAEKQIKAYQNRLADLDKLISSTFEDKVLHGMPESVCANLCTKYQQEKQDILKRIDELNSNRDSEDNERKAQRYLKLLMRYIKFDSLTREACLRLISHIIVGEKTERGREIKIYYKFSLN